MENSNKLLYYAVSNHNIELILDILKTDCNINMKNKQGDSLLHFLLYKYRCHCSTSYDRTSYDRTSYNLTKYDRTKYDRIYATIEILLKNNINVNAININNQSVLNYTMMLYHKYRNDYKMCTDIKKIISLFVQYGADYNEYIIRYIDNNILMYKHVEKLQDKIKLLEKENEVLKIHIAYAPGGDGFLAAQKEFETLNNNNF